MPVLKQDEFELTLREIVDRLRAALSPSLIYLFGSYAYGKPDPHSDLDFLVIVEESPLDAYERDAIAYRALGRIRFPIDVQVYTRAEFEQRAQFRVSFERTVSEKGKIVYAA